MNAAKARRQHAHDGHLNALHAHRAAHSGGVGTEHATPETMTDDGDCRPRPYERRIVVRDWAPQDWHDAKCGEALAADEGGDRLGEYAVNLRAQHRAAVVTAYIDQGAIQCELVNGQQG